MKDSDTDTRLEVFEDANGILSLTVATGQEDEVIAFLKERDVWAAVESGEAGGGVSIRLDPKRTKDEIQAILDSTESDEADSSNEPAKDVQP